MLLMNRVRRVDNGRERIAIDLREIADREASRRKLMGRRKIVLGMTAAEEERYRGRLSVVSSRTTKKAGGNNTPIVVVSIVRTPFPHPSTFLPPSPQQLSSNTPPRPP